MGAGLNAGEDEALEREREKLKNEERKKLQTKTIVVTKHHSCSDCGIDLKYQPWTTLCEKCASKNNPTKLF